jgi:flagellar basal-body rod protein FlgG
MATEGLSSGVLGIRANQASLDVGANNLANVNTPGFKASRANLEDGTGGRGTSFASTSRDGAQGPLLLTGAPFDLAIAGDGFFSVRRADGSLGFTRAGTFQVDGQGRLATPNGDLLDPPITLPAGATSAQVAADGRVTAQVNDATVEAGRIELTRFPNAGGLEAVGGNLLVPTAASGPGTRFFPGRASRLVPGALEGSNVEIAAEIVAQIIHQRAVEANVASIRTQDEVLGTVIDLKR